MTSNEKLQKYYKSPTKKKYYFWNWQYSERGVQDASKLGLNHNSPVFWTDTGHFVLF